MIRLPEGAVILDDAEAHQLAHAVMTAHQFMRSHGAGMNSSVLVLAANIATTSGNPDNPDDDTEQHVEHEQIDTAEAAKLLGCSPRNVRYLADRGRIPGHRVAGRWTFHRDDVLVFRDYSDHTNTAA
jgi:excisionase family DNA binding protein